MTVGTRVRQLDALFRVRMSRTVNESYTRYRWNWCFHDTILATNGSGRTHSER
ncbi:hypothetical protein [Novipirellula herctigrandis]|uniref:hypothetical protein n=1 Tax=Novipirellula herctigrandis TaxID=2527986 RepID=UPI003AF39717